MEVILLDQVRNLGRLGQKVNVKSGYARNFLIPYGKALRATPANIKMFEDRRADLESKAQALLAEAQAHAQKLQGVTVTVKAKASDEGKLFGSVGVIEIVKALADQKHDVSKSAIALPEGPIRSIGEYQVSLQLHTEAEAVITVKVEAE